MAEVPGPFQAARSVRTRIQRQPKSQGMLNMAPIVADLCADCGAGRGGEVLRYGNDAASRPLTACVRLSLAFRSACRYIPRHAFHEGGR